MVGGDVNIARGIIGCADTLFAGTNPLGPLAENVAAFMDGAAPVHHSGFARIIEPPPNVGAHLIVHAIVYFLGQGNGGRDVGGSAVQIVFRHPDVLAVVDGILMNCVPAAVNMAAHIREMVHRRGIIDHRIGIGIGEVKRFRHANWLAQRARVIFHEVEYLGGTPIHPGTIVGLILNRDDIYFDAVDRAV